MAAVDVLLQHLSVKLLGLRVVAREALVAVGNEDAAVAGAFKGTEHTGTGRRALETDVKVALEGAWGILLIELLGHGKSAIRLGNTLVLVREAKLVQGPTSAEKTGRVGWELVSLETNVASANEHTGSPVGETVVDAVAWKLARVSLGENEIALNACVDDLDDDLLVRETDDQAVLGGVAKDSNSYFECRP